MTEDDIVRMADKAFATPHVEPAYSNGFYVVTFDELKRFAELVAAAEKADEREACAKLLDDMAAQDKYTNYYKVAANAIRARGNT